MLSGRMCNNAVPCAWHFVPCQGGYTIPFPFFTSHFGARARSRMSSRRVRDYAHTLTTDNAEHSVGIVKAIGRQEETQEMQAV